MNLPHPKRAARAVTVLIGLWAILAAGPPQRPQPAAAPSPVVKKPPTAPQSQSRCTPLSGEVIPAEKVLADLRDGKSVILQGKTIEGSLDADTIFPAADNNRKASLRTIRGSLKLDSCRITGRVTMRHCVFTQEVALNCTEILGDLDLTDSVVRGALKAERARITSDTRLINTIVQGDLSFRGAVLQGSLDLSGGTLQRVLLTDAEVAGITAEHTLLQTLDMASAKLTGSVRLADVLAHDSITARDTTFGHGLSLSSVKVPGTIQLSWASISGETSFSDVSVDEDLVLPHLFDGPMILSDVAVGRNLLLESGQLQDLTIERLKVGGSTKMTDGRFSGRVVFGDSDFGKTFSANLTVFSGECEFRKVVFPGADPMAGVVFTRKPTLIETKLSHDPTVTTETVDEDETAPPEDDEDSPP